MTSSLTEIRARARKHEEEIASVRWFKVSDLAARWGISETLVRGIPIEELRYKEFGSPGAKIHRRRYKEQWVLAYEEATDRAPVEAARV